MKEYVDDRVKGAETKMAALETETKYQLNNYMTEGETKGWAQSVIEHKIKQVKETIDKNHRDMLTKTVRLNRHITKSGLIGGEDRKPEYECMVDYVVAKAKETDERFCELETNVT